MRIFENSDLFAMVDTFVMALRRVLICTFALDLVGFHLLYDIPKDESLYHFWWLFLDTCIYKCILAAEISNGSSMDPLNAPMFRCFCKVLVV